MLNKDICIKCVNASVVTGKTPQDRWNVEDDKRWEQEGRVICPYADEAIATKVIFNWGMTYVSYPSKDCPYKFEHSVSAGMSHAK